MKNTQPNSKNIVKNNRELIRIIKQSIEKYNEIQIVDLLITYKVDIYDLLQDIRIPIDSSSENMIIDYPVTIERIECDELVFNKLVFNKALVFPTTTKSTINKLSFFDCSFNESKGNSLHISDLICDEFIMMHCISKADMFLGSICCSGNFKIEEIDIIGGLKFQDFKLLPKKDTEFLLEGRVSEDVRFRNCIFAKEATFNVTIGECLTYELINYVLDETVDNSSKVLRFGKICMCGTNIGKRLSFLSCNIGTVDMINVNVDSISEFDFRYNRLMNQAATILRNGALQRNDDITYSKYTADIYDDCLRAISTRKLRKIIHLLERRSSATKNGIEDFKKIERENNKKNRKWKTVEWLWLLLTNLFSEEGLLLWLNKYSNNYNRSWFRGIKFTLIIALIAYFALNYFGMQQPFFEIDWHFNGFGEVLVGYLSLLDIFNLIGNSTMFELTPIGKLLMFLFKIIIAYGEWQTIYAFYKYKK